MPPSRCRRGPYQLAPASPRTLDHYPAQARLNRFEHQEELLEALRSCSLPPQPRQIALAASERLDRRGPDSRRDAGPAFDRFADVYEHVPISRVDQDDVEASTEEAAVAPSECSDSILAKPTIYGGLQWLPPLSQRLSRLH